MQFSREHHQTNSRFQLFSKALPPTPKTPLVSVAYAQGEEHHADLQPWRPTTFRAWYLASLVVITGALITVIVWLFILSNREQGILFAQDINALPLAKTFSYLYLPTVVSVIYGFLWTWVDLDIKRLEPYYQLSKEGGASGKNAINLAYPLEFLITLPYSAFKRKHWHVMSASVIVILVFWGLTPIQAGIFAVRTISVHDVHSGLQTKAYTPLSQQGNTSSLYAQSVYNIAWLNETLPPFMARDYVLSPISPAQEPGSEATNITFTGLTMAYSVDLACEPATLWNNSGWFYYNSTGGCSIQAPTYRPLGGNDTSKPYDTIYAGYQNRDGFAQYYLEGYCGEEFLHLFFVRWSQVTQTYIETPMNTGSMKPSQALNDTSLFCQASYYQQQVNATISLPGNAVLDAIPTGEKVPLPADLFNVSTFEWGMNSGQEQVATRGEYPTTSFPDQKSQLLDMPLNLAWVPKMAPFAIATDKRAAADYLDPDILRHAYQSAYRLLFSRQLVDVLNPDVSSWGAVASESNGTRSYTTQAVIIVPGFAYAAIAILSIVLLIAVGLLATIPRRTTKLLNDPATLGSLMDLSAGDRDTAETFARFARSDSEALNSGLLNVRFELADAFADNSDHGIRLRKVKNTFVPKPYECPLSPGERVTKQGIRPLEMKAYIGVIFMVLQIAAVVTFAVLFANAQHENGLALPSNSTIVRQLLENYIPIALATLIEPFWLILNRLLGMLQPFEELRKCNVPAKRSVDLDYSSLPPQFLFVRAFRARHYTMMLLCFMVLLANVLSVALSGLMYEGTEMIPHVSTMTTPYSPGLVQLNGTGMPFNGAIEENSDGSITVEPFYRAMSNLTADTPLPPWAGLNMTYLPVDTLGLNTSSEIEIETWALSADLQCQTLDTSGSNRYAIEFSGDASSVKLDVTLQYGNDSVNCSNFKPWTRTFAASGHDSLRDPASGRQALEMNAMLSTRSMYESQAGAGQNITDSADIHDLFCRQHVLAGWVRADWQATNSTQNSKGYYDLKATSLDATFILCRPTILAGIATAIFDSTGRVLRPISSDLMPANHYSRSNVSLGDWPQETSFYNLVAQANRFLTDSDATWHNDSFPSDYNNYLIEKMHNSTADTLIDASSSSPWPGYAAEQYANVYNRLFSILVATNHQYLFPPALEGSAMSVTILTPETRILFSTPAFILVQVIFGLYIATTIYFYARRPWRLLPRLPSTIGSQIAFFAGSRALRDMRDGREGWKWGYGEYASTDGKMHVGIEREPYISTTGYGAERQNDPPPYEGYHLM